MLCELRTAANQLIICSYGNWYSRDTDEWETISNFDDVIALGYQTLPAKYHAYYSSNNDVYQRRVENDETYQDLMNRIKRYLERIGLMPKTDLADSTSCHVCTVYYNIDFSTSTKSSGALSGLLNVLYGCLKHVSEAVLEGKQAKSAVERQDSLQVKDDSMDKKNDSMVPKTLSAVESLDGVFKCSKCGSNDNEKIKSTLYCDKCLTVMVIESLEDHGLVNYHGLQPKELKKEQDYVC